MKASLQKNKSGSVIFIAMVLGIALASIAGGYLLLTTQTMKNTQRTFYINTAFNLAESGAEYGIWCMKNTWTLPSSSWTGDSAARTYIGSVNSPVFTDSQGSKGYFKVRITNTNSSNPTIYSEGVIVSKQGGTLTKQIRVKLSNSNQGWKGNITKDKLTLNGGELDSYRSSEGSPSTAAKGYDIMVASTAIEIGDVSIGSAADIYGYVAIAPSGGSSAASTFLSSIQGSIVGPSTAAGQAGVQQHGSNLIDTNRIAYDFTQDFPDQTVPAATATTITETSLPSANTQNIIEVGSATDAALGITRRYQLNSVNIPNGTTLMIKGPVEFVVATTFNVAGNGALVVLNSPDTLWVATKISGVTSVLPYVGLGSAKLYVKGDISISGNGSMNAPYKPSGLQIFGTLTQTEYNSGARQSITIGGNGNMTAAINAPNSDVVMNGGGSSGFFAGASIARSSRINGNGYKFRFDRDLESEIDPTAYKVSSWVELTSPADRYSFGG